MSTSYENATVEPHAPRDRRESIRVPLAPLTTNLAATPGCRITDISTGGVGFVAPRRDAELLDDALVLVNVDGASLFRAVVQRVELGGSSEEWVRVGARFDGLGGEHRARLRALVAAHDAPRQ